MIEILAYPLRQNVNYYEQQTSTTSIYHPKFWPLLGRFLENPPPHKPTQPQKIQEKARDHLFAQIQQ